MNILHSKFPRVFISSLHIWTCSVSGSVEDGLHPSPHIPKLQLSFTIQFSFYFPDFITGTHNPSSCITVLPQCFVSDIAFNTVCLIVTCQLFVSSSNKKEAQHTLSLFLSFLLFIFSTQTIQNRHRDCLDQIFLAVGAPRPADPCSFPC